MAAFLGLPDDIFFLILLQFIFGPQIEQLIKLDTVCKRLRQQCLCRALWVAALETLEYRPPFISSRSILLNLSTADLRKEIIRAIKLDRSWLSEAGPKKTSEELIPVINYVPYFQNLCSEPQVDLIIAKYSDSVVQCWSISQKRVVWEYVVTHEGEDAEEGELMSLTMTYDVVEDLSSVMIALSWTSDRQWPYHARKFRVYQLDSHSFDCKLLFESPLMPRNSNIDKYMTIHNEYLLVSYSTGPGFIVMNWRDRTYFRIEGKSIVNTALTHDFLLLVRREPTESGFRLISIRLKDLLGSSTENPKDWPLHHVPEDIEDRGAYSHIILPFEAIEEDPDLLDIQSGIAAGVSSWSRCPKTHLSVTLIGTELDDHGRLMDMRKSIFNVELKPGGDGKGVFTILHEYHYDDDDDLSIYENPSLAFRTLVGNEDELPQTYAVAFNDNGDCYHRRKALEFFPADRSEDDIAKISMDPLGRMVVYQLSSGSRAEYVGVIRFD